MKSSKAVIIGIIVLSFLIGIYLYPRMPLMLASHWNARGQVDGYMSKFWGLFLMPIISTLMYLLFITLPKIDPMKANVDKFRKYFDGFIVAIITFLFYLYLLTIFWNLGYKFSLIQFLSPAFALLFYSVGILIEKAKRNWFIGIRTPWTLSSDKVWDKTHKLGGKLYKLSALFSLLGLLFPLSAIYFVIIPIITFSLYLFVYSYLEFQKN